MADNGEVLILLATPETDQSANLKATRRPSHDVLTAMLGLFSGSTLGLLAAIGV